MVQMELFSDDNIISKKGKENKLTGNNCILDSGEEKSSELKDITIETLQMKYRERKRLKNK